jgi:hypothetical protein
MYYYNGTVLDSNDRTVIYLLRRLLGERIMELLGQKVPPHTYKVGDKIQWKHGSHWVGTVMRFYTYHHTNGDRTPAVDIKITKCPYDHLINTIVPVLERDWELMP